MFNYRFASSYFLGQMGDAVLIPYFNRSANITTSWSLAHDSTIPHTQQDYLYLLVSWTRSMWLMRTGPDPNDPYDISNKWNSQGHWTLVLRESEPVPEPATLVLFSAGIGLISWRRRRRKQAA